MDMDKPNPKKRKMGDYNMPIFSIDRNWDLILNGEKSYSVKGFNGKEVDIEIRLESTTISPNELPRERFIFKNNVIDLITSTKACLKIEDKFGEIFKVENQKNYYIRGPSGTGKTFALLYGTLMLKNYPGSKENFRVVHIILSTNYLEDFLMSFLKDLLFCFSIDRGDPEFPRPPNPELNECPIKAWLKYILQEKDALKRVRNIKELTIGLQQFCAQKNKKLWLIIDEENVFQRGKKKMLTEYDEFKEYLRRGGFSDVVIHGFSERDEMIALPKKISKESTVYLNSLFEDNDVEMFLKFYYPKINEIEIENLRLYQKILSYVKGTTGSNPLELIKFVDYNKSMAEVIEEKYESMCKNYMNQREYEITSDHEIFFKKNFSDKKDCLEKFLCYFLKVLSQEKIYGDKSYEIYVDKKYIYVDEETRLKFTCPIAKRVFTRMYNDKATNLESEDSKFFKSIPQILSFSELNQSGKGALFEFYIVSILESTKKKKFDFLYSTIGEKIKNTQAFSWEKQTLSLEYDLCQDIYPGHFENIKQLKVNCLLIPTISNFFAIDFIYWKQNENCFYVFQCTVNVISHKKSDIEFKQSEFYKRLSASQKNKCQIKFIWICGPCEITLETIGNEHMKKPFDENSGFLFPKDNTHIFRNLNIY